MIFFDDAKDKDSQESQSDPSKKSFTDYVEESVKELEGEEEDTEETETDEETDTEEPGEEEVKPGEEEDTDKEPKKKVKLSASERIQELVAEKNTLKDQADGLKTEVNNLREELGVIKDQLKSGKITKEEAEERTEEAQDTIDAIVDKIEVSEELQPFKKDILNMIKAVSGEIVKSKLAPYEQREQEKEIQAAEKQAVATYNNLAKDFTELFITDDKGKFKLDKNGVAQLKPEYDKKALEILKEFDEEIVINGQKVLYNPMVKKEKGMRMVLDQLYQSIKAVKKVKKSKEEMERIKKGRIESPESVTTSTKEKKTFRDYFDAEAEKQPA